MARRGRPAKEDYPLTDRVGRVEYRAGRAIVLFQPNHFRTWEVLLIATQVLNSRATPPVDRLVVIADDKRYARFAGEQLQPIVLNRVSVLKFVDEQMLKTRLILGEQLLILS